MSKEQQIWDTALADIRSRAQGRPTLTFSYWGVFELRRKTAESLALDIKECALSREQIADQLGDIHGRRFTRAQIDAWTAETKQHQFPTYLLPAWTLVTGSTRLLDLLCAAAGLYLADQRDYDLAALARAGLEAERLQKQRRELRSKLTGGES